MAPNEAGRIREVFDAWARTGRAEGMERGHSHAARLAFDRLRLKPDAAYLDIGCGNGYSVRWAAAAAPSGNAVGLDLSPEMIEHARRMSAGFSNAFFVVGAYPGAELPHGPFDAVLSVEAFYYFADLDAALTKTRDLLKPGALFACVVDYYGENSASHSWPDDLGVSMHLLDSFGWADAFRRAGLAVVDQKRLRQPAGQAAEAWKATEGSLLTLGKR